MLLSPLLLLVLVTVACAGDGENPYRVLELGIGPITEEDFRAGLRAADGRHFGDMRRLCDFTYFSVDENAEKDAVTLAVDLIAGNAAANTEQVPADMERAAEILREECARWKNI